MEKTVYGPRKLDEPKNRWKPEENRQLTENQRKSNWRRVRPLCEDAKSQSGKERRWVEMRRTSEWKPLMCSRLVCKVSCPPSFNPQRATRRVHDGKDVNWLTVWVAGPAKAEDSLN